MTDLKFKVVADLSEFKRQLKNLKVDFGIKGNGDSNGKDEEKKQTGFLGGILKALGPLAILLTLKPILDILEILKNFVILGIIKIIQFLPSILDGLKSIWTIIVEWLKYGWDMLRTKLTEIWTKITETIKEWLNVAIEWIKALPEEIWNWLKMGFELIRDKFVEWISKAVDWLKSIASNIWERLKPIAEFLKQLWETIKEKFKENIEKLKTLASDIWEKLKVGFDTIKEWLSTVVDWIKQLPQLIWDKMKQLGTIIANKIKELIGRFNPFSTSVDDAIITKEGKVIKTNPNDTIIATQTPGSTGASTVFNFYGVTEDQFIDKVKRELFIDRVNISRF